ncbi:helix-turn-helix transcriptional regulator [Lactobacillus delbrueckii]|uniref:helix-turn-helix transcriptional regulator n=1 Tax=Lactobacillus delbrueckii TaxID=1584 RepID=UPI003A883E63
MAETSKLLSEFQQATDLDLCLYSVKEEKIIESYTRPLAVLPKKHLLRDLAKEQDSQVQLKQEKYLSLLAAFPWKENLVVAWSTSYSLKGKGNYDRQVPLLSVERFRHLLFCLYWLLYQKEPVFRENIGQIATGDNLGLAMSDKRPSLAGYLAEEKIMADVRQGDLEKYNQDFRDFVQVGNFGRFNPTSLRSKKNIAIAATTLYTRAAIGGGLSIPEAYQVSDEIIKGIESDVQISNLYEYTRAIGEIFINRLCQQKRQAVSPLVYRAQQYVNEHLNPPPDLAEIAGQLHVSQSYLQHIFKEETGQGVKNYIDQQRLLKAKQLLRFSSDSVTDLAQQLGYSSPSQFSQFFKRLTGQSPQQFRKQADQKENTGR